jgi:AcrR family transcriptional regulator
MSTASRATPSDATERPRIGRPPRIDLDAIARAVIELGFADVTMKSTAEHLGVSVPGLYHYVNGKDDLIRVAADYQLATLVPPVYRDQDWPTWLTEWANHTYRSLSSRPELFDLYVTDELDEDRTMQVLSSALGPLLEMGFTPEMAVEAWGLISAIALGSAALAIQARAEATAGRPWLVKVHTALARSTSTTREALEAMSTTPRVPVDVAFERRLALVIDALRPHIDTETSSANAR